MEVSKAVLASILAILVNAGPIQRVSNGSSVAIEEFPFLAAVSTPAGGQHCGGAILTSYYVMTAAHCVLPGLQVRVGSSLRSSGGLLLDVIAVSVHPSYIGTLTADLAVLGLAEPIVFDHGAVSQAPIPFQDAPLVGGVFGYVAGWGLDRLSGEPSEQLMFGEVTTDSLESCAASYQDLAITDVLVCTSASSIDFCPGDTGGPLISSGMVTGVATHGHCGERELPSLYTNVAKFSNWLISEASGVPNGGDDGFGGERKGIELLLRIRT